MHKKDRRSLRHACKDYLSEELEYTVKIKYRKMCNLRLWYTDYKHVLYFVHDCNYILVYIMQICQ